MAGGWRGAVFAGNSSSYTYDSMGNLLQMSITSGQDTDSRQFTLAASSHRLAGETYDANGNRTSGSADGFTSVSYNILNLPETVTAGGWTINYLYYAAVYAQGGNILDGLNIGSNAQPGGKGTPAAKPMSTRKNGRDVGHHYQTGRKYKQ